MTFYLMTSLSLNIVITYNRTSRGPRVSQRTGSEREPIYDQRLRRVVRQDHPTCVRTHTAEGTLHVPRWVPIQLKEPTCFQPRWVPIQLKEPYITKVSSNTTQGTLHVPIYGWTSSVQEFSGRISSLWKLLDLEFPCSRALCGKGWTTLLG